MNEQTKLLPQGLWARSGRKIADVLGVIIHWPSAPGQHWNAIWKWWATRDDTYGSAHYIIDQTGLVVNCIPEDEAAYHVGALKYTDWALAKFGPYPNFHTLGIEICHDDLSGQPTIQAEDAAVALCRKLCYKYDLNPITDIATHYAVSEKRDNNGPCHKWYVDFPEEFAAFRESVRSLQ
jgi:N-acetylmuramoyl-L-alanine amidase CwlA